MMDKLELYERYKKENNIKTTKYTIYIQRAFYFAYDLGFADGVKNG